MSTIVGLLKEAQERFGNKPALVMRRGYRTERWSYLQLWLKSGQIAAYVQRQGVRQGDRVILWAHNSPEWVAAFFGCLRAGAIVVPLDIRSPVEFVHKVVERTQPTLALLSDATAGYLDNPRAGQQTLERVIESSAGTGRPPRVAPTRGTPPSQSFASLKDMPSPCEGEGDKSPQTPFTKGGLTGQGEGRPERGLGIPAIRLEDLEALLEVMGSSTAGVEIAPGDIAEVIFTSGTTGEPKGVILTHANIVANVEAATRMVPSKPSYRLLSLLPLSHMLEQTVGLLAPLSGGASICYPQSRQSTVIFRAFKEHRITTMVLVPQALQLFMSAIESRVAEEDKERQWHLLHQLAPRLPIALRRRLFGPVHRRLGGSLQFIICGGAYLDPALARKWEAMGIFVLQGYGTTEAAPIVSCNTLKRRKLDSIGMPLPGVEVKVSGEGEILVKGDNITAGYWQDSQTTQAAFENGWYKTGDLGSLDQDGFLYFKGRKKDLIVLSSGLNVYPEDIEAALKSHPDVADAVVVGLPGKGQEVQVHAVLLLKDGNAAAKPIVEQANARLAEHQRIRGFTVWPEADFPRTHTLKVKKHQVLEQLARPKIVERPAVTLGRSQSGSASPLIQTLARLTEMPVEQIQASMRLSEELGLDSLRRVELLAALETELGVYLDESHLTAETTVGDLEALVAHAGRAPQDPKYMEWPLRRLVRLGGAAAQSALVFPMLRLMAPLQIEGREHLRELEEPVLFAANHLSHLDSPAVLAALPLRWRLHTAVAAAADVWFDQGGFKPSLAAFLFNAFPFSRTDSIRPSLEHCSRLLNRGWSVLIYPEGTRSNTGRTGAFKSGTGSMAVELGVPVVPVHIQGTYAMLAKGQSVPRRGRVQVRFGEALRFTPKTPYVEATRAIEGAVATLGEVQGRREYALQQ